MAVFFEFFKTNTAQILGVISSLVLFYAVFMLVKQGRIQERYSLIWFLIAFIIFLISFFKQILDNISGVLGILYPPNALFAIMLGFTYILLLNVSTNISTVKRQNKSLIQEIGLLKERLEQLEKEKTDDKE